MAGINALNLGIFATGIKFEVDYRNSYSATGTSSPHTFSSCDIGVANSNRYVFGVYVDGLITSDLYLEMWDDNTFSTHNLTTLSGSLNYPHSVFNAIRTTDEAPPENWTGASGNAVYLAGYENRLRLKGSDNIQNEALYYSMYAAIPWDLEFTHDQPIEGYRYLYI